MATDKVIQCGDFYQLSPIAEANDAVWLKSSIFDNCGITEKVTNNEETKSLAILDTQYRCHPNSAKLALELTAQGFKSGIESISIITPYNAQAKYIRNNLGLFRETYPEKKIEAATVHKYQGREMDMIIFDLIDAPAKSGLAPFLKGVHGGVAMRLINVATTRARGKFIVIANVDFIERVLYKEGIDKAISIELSF